MIRSCCVELRRAGSWLRSGCADSRFSPPLEYQGYVFLYKRTWCRGGFRQQCTHSTSSSLLTRTRNLLSYLHSHITTHLNLNTLEMPSFFKSRSSRDASSFSSSSSSSLLIAQEKQPHSPAQKDYSAAFGTLSSQYGYGPSMVPSQPAAYHVALSKSSQSQSSSNAHQAPANNVKQVRAKDLGALQNKYGAIGHGGMASII